MKTFWDKLIEKRDRLTPEELEGFIRSLARQKELLDAIFESISDAIIVVDHESNVLYMNPSAREMFGISGRSSTGKHISKLLPDFRLVKFFEQDLTERSPFATEIEVKRPRQMTLQVNIFPYKTDDNVDGTIVIFRDFTQIRKQEMEAFQSEKLGALSTLAAGVAHEIGNPLNSIGIHMHLMDKEIKKLRNRKTRENLEQYVQSTKTEVNRLDNMVRTFLTAIRPTPLNLEEHNVNHILEGVLDFLYYEISGKNIAIEKEYSQQIPLTSLDEAQIRQMFFNVIKNAVEAMPDGGVLTVHTEVRNNEVAVVIGDTGIGIAKENMNRIFEPYFTTKQRGSGLGLMIVYKIVKEHGGRIEAESTEGKGTRITVILPIYERRVRMIKDGRKRENSQEDLK